MKTNVHRKLLLAAAVAATVLPALSDTCYSNGVAWEFSVDSDGNATITGASPSSGYDYYYWYWDGIIPSTVYSGNDSWGGDPDATYYPVTAIGDSALSGLQNTSSSPDSYGSYAPSSIYIPDTVTYIGDSVFSPFYATLTDITLPDGLEYLGSDAFYGCDGLSYDYEFDPNYSVKSLQGWVVGVTDSYYIESVDISGAKGVAAGVFSSCENLRSALLPVNMTVVPKNLFYYCSSLTDIVVPASVTNIEYGVFSYATSLTNIIFIGNAPATQENPYYAGENAFTGINQQCVVTVQQGTTGWGTVPGTWNGLTTRYATAPSTYTVTWLDDDGTLIDESSSWVPGATPWHTNPTKEETAEFTYTFSHWTPELEPVTSNATYRAVYTAERKSYCITWYNERGGWIGDTTVPYGTVPTRAAPAKAATAFHTYEFAGWSPTPVPVTGEATYRATFTAVPKYAGSGTEADPFVATNKADLVALVSATNTLYVQLAQGLVIDGPITVPASMATLSIDMNDGTIAGSNGDPAIILLGNTAFSAKGTGTISADAGVPAVRRPATITASSGVTITGLGGGGDAGSAVFADGCEAITTRIAPGANGTWMLTAFAELASGSADGLDDAQVKVYAADTLAGLASAQPMASGVVVTNKAPAVKVELEVTPPANSETDSQFFRVGFGE